MRAKVIVKATIEELNGSTRTWELLEQGNFDDDKTCFAYSISRLAKILGEGGILELDHEKLGANFIPLRRILELNTSIEKISILDSTDVEAAKHEAAAAKAVDDAVRGNSTIEFPTSAKTGKGWKM